MVYEYMKKQLTIEFANEILERCSMNNPESIIIGLLEDYLDRINNLENE